MAPRFVQFCVAMLLAVLSTNNYMHGAAGREVPHFEVDVIFPRNETYLSDDTFPIAVAIRNLTAVRLLGDFEIIWGIMPYSHGYVPGGITYDLGNFTDSDPLEDNNSDTVILIDNTNATDWITRKQVHESYMLQLYLHWPEHESRCGFDAGIFKEPLMFSVEVLRRWKGPCYNESEAGVEPNAMEAPECPVLSGVASIRPNTTDPSCPTVDKNPSIEGDPCALVVDEAKKSSIASQAASLATPPSSATPTPTSRESENAARSVGSSARTALAAGFALGSLALGS